jgi:ABC-type uncharacterized transport system YnjBCD permease subunit
VGVLTDGASCIVGCESGMMPVLCKHMRQYSLQNELAQYHCVNKSLLMSVQLTLLGHVGETKALLGKNKIEYGGEVCYSEVHWFNK